MQVLKRAKLLIEAEHFFCRGMATDSYASGAKASAIEYWSGWKGFEYREGDFKLVDMYTIHPDSKKSGGHTHIHYQGKTIWMMSYGGFYKKDATSCLKASLLLNYGAGIFNFGRGKSMFRLEDYSYDISGQGDFNRFVANEHVQVLTPRGDHTPTYEPAGGHQVWGMALI